MNWFKSVTRCQSQARNSDKAAMYMFSTVDRNIVTRNGAIELNETERTDSLQN